MKKVLLVTDTWSPQVNGVVNTWKNLLSISKKNDMEVKVIHPYLFSNFSWPFYKEIRLPLVRYKTVISLIKEYNPEYIHIATEGILGWHTRNYCIKKNYLFSTSVDLIYELFNFESRINSNLLSKSIKIIGKNKIVNSFFKKFADIGIRI